MNIFNIGSQTAKGRIINIGKKVDGDIEMPAFNIGSQTAKKVINVDETDDFDIDDTDDD